MRSSLATAGIVLVTALYIVTGWFLATQVRSYSGDTLARTQNALAVLLSRDPHIAAIGFVWQPLPSMLQIPLILVPGLARDGMSGVVISSIGGAVGLVAFWHLLAHLGVPAFWRVLASLLLAATPMYWLYASNGMSETLFIAFCLWQLLFLVRWRDDRRVRNLLLAAGMGAGAFWTRYEAIPFTLATLAWIFVVEEPRRLRTLTGIGLTYLVPLAYSVSLWILLNYQFTGDPLFFLRGEYSNAAIVAFTQGADAQRLPIQQAVAVVGVAMLSLAPLAAVGVVAGIWHVFTGRNRAAVLFALGMLSLFAFQVYLTSVGQSFLFLRFFLLVVPVGALLMAAAFRQSRHLAGIACALSLLIGIGSGFIGIERFGYQERDIMRALVSGTPLEDQYAGERELARAINDLGDGMVAIDSSTGFPVILMVDDPRKLAVTSDRDFVDLIRNVEEPESPLRYIAVWNPRTFIVPSDSINGIHPGLYDRGAPWAQLIHQSPGRYGWKLYRIQVPRAT